jgi:hypothetical protein
MKYYMLFYKFTEKNGGWGSGRCPIIVKQGELNLSGAEKQLQKTLKFKKVIISNFIEISKKMYDEE